MAILAVILDFRAIMALCIICRLEMDYLLRRHMPRQQIHLTVSYDKVFRLFVKLMTILVPIFKWHCLGESGKRLQTENCKF